MRLSITIPVQSIQAHGGRNSGGVHRWQRITRVFLTLLTPAILLAPGAVAARPVNMEFKFTPYLPPARDAETVTSVEGRTELELNGVPLAEEPLTSKSHLVMAGSQEAIEVFPAVWINALQLQPLLRQRAALFSPDFEAAYRFLGSLSKDRGITLDMPEVRRLGCLEAGYATGMRVAAPADGDLKLITTGSPVVVARGTGECLMRFPDQPGTAEHYQALPNDQGFCLAITLNMLFLKRLLLVKGVDGQWQILQ